MVEVMSEEYLEQLLEPIPYEGSIGWPVLIDYQTFCQRLNSYGFSNTKIAQVKAALIEAELAYRYFGKRKEVKA